jgi:glyoxylase-like metal-dependent hydrolase (beta-lactamase superfamily II)
MLVQRFENTPISSNCFVIYPEKGRECIVVDPGTENCNNILPFLNEHGLNVEYCFLTHEHIDHIVGLKLLKEKYGCKVVCSKNCADHLNDIKYNLSDIIDQFLPHQSFPGVDISFDDCLELSWQNSILQFFVMLGHSRGSAIMVVDNELIIGDNLIKGARTKANFFGGSKKDLLATLITVLDKYGDKDLMVHCGHFESCSMKDIKPEIESQIEFLKNKI